MNYLWRLLSLRTIGIIATLIVLCSCKATKDSESYSLKLNFAEEPSTFDSIKAADYISASLQFFIGEGLTRMIPNETAALGLAESIEVSQDSRTYTFHLKKAKWSNGEYITASDFERAWKKALDPTYPCSNAILFYPIVGAKQAKMGEIPLEEIAIKVIDNLTFQVTLEMPTPHFLQILSFCTLFPLHKEHVIDYKDLKFCGPYCIAEYKPQQHLILRKNPHYWDSKNVTCEVIHISLIKNMLTALELFRQKKLDLIGMPFTPISADIIKTFANSSSIKVQPLAGTTILALNTKHPFFSNRNLRKAFSLAINREVIVNHVTGLGEKAAYGIIPTPLKPKGLTSHLPEELDFLNLQTESAEEFNNALAMRYLQLALKELHVSMQDLSSLTLYYNINSYGSKIAEVIQEQIYNALGVKIKLSPLEQKIFTDHLSKKDFDLCLCTLIAQYFDPINFLERFSDKGAAKNYPSFSSAKYNTLIHLILKELIPENRERYILQAENILREECPIIPLYYNSSAYIIHPSVKNIQINPTGGFFLCQAEVQRDL